MKAKAFPSFPHKMYIYSLLQIFFINIIFKLNLKILFHYLEEEKKDIL
jgi:hypothetical protein